MMASSSVQNGFQVVDRLGFFNFGQHRDVVGAPFSASSALQGQQCPLAWRTKLREIISTPWETPKSKILLVFVGEGGQAQVQVRQVDAFATFEGAPLHHAAGYFRG
jgi:hypothetical protein